MPNPLEEGIKFSSRKGKYEKERESREGRVREGKRTKGKKWCSNER